MGRGTVAGVALADGAQSSCEEGQPCQLLLWAPLLEVSRAAVSMACRKDPFQSLSCFNLKPVPDLLKHFSKSTLGPGSSFHIPQGFHIKTWEMAHKYIFAINHQSTAIIYSLRCGPEIQLSHISRENTSGVAAPPIFSSARLPTAFLGYATWHP